MFRFAVTVAVILTLVKNTSARMEKQYDFISYRIQSEFRHDTLIGDTRERQFFREKVTIFFSKESKLHCAYVYIDHEHSRRFTWSLVLRDISPVASLFVGYYYVNFGKGLLIGRKRMLNPDTYAQEKRRPGDKSFAPCMSGNPFFAFRGVALSYYEQFTHVDISMNCFYSTKKRFIDDLSYDRGSTARRINTIEYETEKNHRYSQPVEVITHGSECTVHVIDLIHVGMHYVYTDISSFSRKGISWESSRDGEGGMSNLVGYGLLIQYRDDYTEIFFEKDITIRDRNRENRYGVRNIIGSGMIYGLIYSNSFMRTALILKNTEEKYNAPYGSSIGVDYPEKMILFDLTVRPFARVKLGSSISCERKKCIDQRVYNRPVMKKERIFITYRNTVIRKLMLTFRRVEERREFVRKRFQVRSGSEIEFWQHGSLLFSTTYQIGNHLGASKLYTAGIQIKANPFFKSVAYYGRAEVSEDNEIYAVLSPMRSSNVPGIFLRQHSQIIVVKAECKYRSFIISMRTFYQFSSQTVIHRRFEIYGSGNF